MIGEAENVIIDILVIRLWTRTKIANVFRPEDTTSCLSLIEDLYGLGHDVGHLILSV